MGRRSAPRSSAASIGSMIFWGPPGTGKTTLGRLIAQYTDREFVPFSAVTEGVPRVREIVAEAEERLRARARDDSFRRRDSSLQSRAAGCVSPTRRAGDDHAHRRDDGESIVRGERRAAIPHARLRARSADRRRSCCVIDRALNDASAASAPVRITIADDARVGTRSRERRGCTTRAHGARGFGDSDVGDGGKITVDVVRDALQKRFAHARQER